MKVILIKAVPKVGKKDEVIEVSDGYAHHALFPKKLAIPATAQALKTLAQKIDGAAAQIQMQHQLLKKTLEELSSKTVTMPARANAGGNLFAKIDKQAIAEFLAREYRAVIDPATIQLAEPIKHTGTYEVPVIVRDFQSSFMLTVIRID